MSEYRVSELTEDVTSLLRRGPSVWGVWGRKRVDPNLREEVMVAVAQAVGCRFCTFSHREMILNSGEPVRALAEFEGEENKDDRTFTAIVWAQSLVENDFQASSPAIDREFRDRFTDRERHDLETIAISMKLMSSCGHQADGLLSRMKGKPRPGGQLGNELIMALLYFPPAAVVYGALMAKRRNPKRMICDFRSFSARFDSRSI